MDMRKRKMDPVVRLFVWVSIGYFELALHTILVPSTVHQTVEIMLFSEKTVGRYV